MTFGRTIEQHGAERMGFILGTIATAITFAIVAYVLPQIEFGGSILNLLILAVIAGV
ncbi:MAG: hypothetical protein H0U58_01140, partial [Chloroflexi bacterium]|nr:hypothetical protein [Chloroflexota bacterium]